MQGTTGNQGNQNGAGSKPSGLSWSQPAVNTTSNASNSGSNTSKTSTPSFTPRSAPTPPVKSMSPAARIPQTSTSAFKLLGIFAAGVVVGFLIGWVWFSLRPGGNETTGTTGSTATSTQHSNTTSGTSSTSTAGITGQPTIPTTTTSSIITVNSQTAGLKVMVASANVTRASWIAIYENSNGQLGRALGAAMFFPEYKGRGGEVELLKATVAGQSYFAVLQVDNGDHKFSVRGDAQGLDNSGKPVIVEFKAL